MSSDYLTLRRSRFEIHFLALNFDYLNPALICLHSVQEVDEFIIGLPKSGQGQETEQSNKVRSVAGRLAVRAAERYTIQESNVSACIRCRVKMQYEISMLISISEPSLSCFFIHIIEQ